MSNLGDMKTQTYVYLKHILDTFKYLVNAYKDDEEELEKLVDSFNEAFGTIFLSKYIIKYLIKKYNIQYDIIEDKILYTYNEVEEFAKYYLDKNVSQTLIPLEQGIRVGGDNNEVKENTYKYNVIKLLQYLTFIDTLHDFKHSDKLKKIYGNLKDDELTEKIINDVKDGFKKKMLYITSYEIDNMNTLKIGEDEKNLQFMIDRAKEMLEKINKDDKKKFKKLVENLDSLHKTVFYDEGNNLLN